MVHSDAKRDEFSARLRKALDQSGNSERGAGTRLAKMLGVTPKAASKWLNGEAMPGHAKLIKLAGMLNVREEWLRYGVGPMRRDEPHHGNVSEVQGHYQNALHRYPVINWVRAGAWMEAVNPYDPGCEQQFESSDYTAKGHAFWLEVEGDSMTAPAGLSIPQGMLILVDPEVEAKNGSLVVAQLDDSNEDTFKKLVIDGGEKYLKPLNPSYPLKVCGSNCRIVGVAVEMKMSLRASLH